jgi:hypothetical protein
MPKNENVRMVDLPNNIKLFQINIKTKSSYGMNAT